MRRARPVRSAAEGLKTCPHRLQNRWLSACCVPQFQQSGKVPPGGPLAVTSREIQSCAVGNHLPGHLPPGNRVRSRAQAHDRFLPAPVLSFGNIRAGDV